MVEDTFVTKSITLISIAIIFLITIYVLKPIIFAIIIGLLLAYIFQPVYKKIKKKIKGRNLSTILLISLIFFVIAIPTWFLLPALISQTFDTYQYFQTINMGDLVRGLLPNLVSERVATIWVVHFNNLVSKFFSSLLNQFTSILVNIPNLLLQFAVVLFTFYFTTRDADKLKDYASKLSPFSKSTELKFLKEFRNITNAIIFGQVLIGIAQGLALGIGLFILGVPRALILTVVAIFASIIPVLGSWLVWLPTSIFLLATGSIFKGVLLLVYGALFVSTIDNILRPYFLSRKSNNLPVAIALIGIIGGLYAFGLIGIILGPLILAYAIIILEFYRQGKLNELFRK